MHQNSIFTMIVNMVGPTPIAEIILISFEKFYTHIKAFLPYFGSLVLVFTELMIRFKVEHSLPFWVCPTG